MSGFERGPAFCRSIFDIIAQVKMMQTRLTVHSGAAIEAILVLRSEKSVQMIVSQNWTVFQFKAFHAAELVLFDQPGSKNH